MSEVKEAWIRALEESANNLEKVLGSRELPGLSDIEGIHATMSDKNFVAKAKWADLIEVLRGQAASLRRGDVKQGDWPLFRPEAATKGMKGVEFLREQLESDTPNEILRTAIMKAVKPQRDVIEKYGIQVDGVWGFRDEDCDEIPPFPSPPPDPNIRHR